MIRTISAARLLYVPVCMLAVLWGAPAVAQQRQPPYWASIDEPKARMRTGPSTEFPTMWMYQRERLPLKVIARYQSWRKIEDPDGTQGWMHARLLSASQTAIVTDEIRPMRAEPRDDAPLTWRAEPGVVGRITECDERYCLFDVRGRRGYIRLDYIWGDEPLDDGEE